VSSAPAGLLDTNVFVHALANDPQTQECQAFLAALATGTNEATIEPIVLHELSYALPRFVKQMTPGDVARYMLGVLQWPGVQGDKDLLTDAVRRWAQSPAIGFADAYLAALATQRGCPVYTKNVRDLTAQGVAVPDPLPTVSAP
jgi:predicted nucleic acid-binding protein